MGPFGTQFFAEVTYPIGSMIWSHQHDDFSELNQASPITGEVFLGGRQSWNFTPSKKVSREPRKKKGRILSMSYPGCFLGGIPTMIIPT